MISLLDKETKAYDILTAKDSIFNKLISYNFFLKSDDYVKNVKILNSMLQKLLKSNKEMDVIVAKIFLKDLYA
jgi:hypothetical protein